MCSLLSSSQSFHSYFTSEHSRLLMVWRQVVGFRRHVCEMKSATERLTSAMCTSVLCVFWDLCTFTFHVFLPSISGTCQKCETSWPGSPTLLRCPVQVCPPRCTAEREGQLWLWRERRLSGFSWSSSSESD